MIIDSIINLFQFNVSQFNVSRYVLKSEELLLDIAKLKFPTIFSGSDTELQKMTFNNFKCSLNDIFNMACFEEIPWDSQKIRDLLSFIYENEWDNNWDNDSEPSICILYYIYVTAMNISPELTNCVRRLNYSRTRPIIGGRPYVIYYFDDIAHAVRDYCEGDKVKIIRMLNLLHDARFDSLLQNIIELRYIIFNESDSECNYKFIPFCDTLTSEKLMNAEKNNLKYLIRLSTTEKKCLTVTHFVYSTKESGRSIVHRRILISILINLEQVFFNFDRNLQKSFQEKKVIFFGPGFVRCFR